MREKSGAKYLYVHTDEQRRQRGKEEKSQAAPNAMTNIVVIAHARPTETNTDKHVSKGQYWTLKSHVPTSAIIN